MSIQRERGLVLSELMFIVLLVSAMVLVVFVGRLSLDEARRTEAAKEAGVLLLKALDELSAESAAPPAAVRDRCKPGEAAAPKEGEPAEKTWTACREALTAAGGPLHEFKNPFEQDYAVFAEKCDRNNRTTRGAIVVEELLKGAPGQPATYAPIAASRALEKDLGIRIAVCDKGSFVIKIGESKL